MSLLLILSALISAQGAELKTSKLIKPGGTLAANPPTVAEQWTALVGTSSIPVSFSEIKWDNGKMSVGSSLSLGYSYCFMLADVTQTTRETITLDPHLLLGAAISAGAEPPTEPGAELDPKLSIAVIGGIDKIALTYGYDIAGGTTFLGVSARIDLMALSDKTVQRIHNFR